MAARELTAREAIVKALGEPKKPMKVPAIIEAAMPLTNLGGKTPGQTIYSLLYGSNKKTGTARQFIQVRRGTFNLNPKFKPAGQKSAAA